MAIFFYSSIDQLKDAEVQRYFSFLPKFMSEEICRYKNINDRKLKLLARLMLYKCLKDDFKIDFLNNWRTDINNKPYIINWKHFNISHSAKLVLLGLSNEIIGIDIEKKTDLDFQGIAQYFHLEEQNYIFNSNNTKDRFFEIWVKKEAFLKAIGIGMRRNLFDFSCVGNEIRSDEKKWMFKELNIDNNYVAFACFEAVDDEMSLKKFDLKDLSCGLQVI